jgi:glycosyltransferase involved in cell wall biosynthesis
VEFLMKKVLIVMATLYMGGAEKSLISLLNTMDPQYLAEQRINIYLLTADSKSGLMKLIPEFVNVIECPTSFRTFALSKSRALSYSKIKLDVYIRKVMWSLSSKSTRSNLTKNELYWLSNKKFISNLPGEYDVCLAYMNGTSTYYAIDRVNAKKKFVWMHNEYGKLVYTDEYQKKYFDAADAVVTISERCVESILEHFPDLKDKVKMVENISVASLIFKQSEEYFPEEYYGYDGIKILSVGRLHEQKGFDIGLDSMKILKDMDINFRWYIVGEGDERSNLQKRILELGLQDYVYLLGLRENPYPYIKNADIFFQPSRFEGKSITLDESKILARPIVVSSYNTVYDSIKDGFNGLICELNHQSLAEGIKQLIENDFLRGTFTNNLKKNEYGNIEEVLKYYELML